MNFDNRSAGDDACAEDKMTGTDEKVVNFAEARQAKRSRAEQAADKATEKADEARRRAEEEAAERAEQVAALRAHMLAFLIDNDVHYCGATDCWWLWTERDRSWLPLKERAVRMLLPGVLFDREGWGMFTGVMEDEGRNHRRITSSFKPQPDGVLNMMRPNFCPVADRADYHPFFDTLMTSLSDGDEAAKAHIEKLILSKHQHPDNHLLPALCIHNEDGGAGKNLFVSGLLTTVFGKEMVAESLTMDDLSGRFNDHLTGKAVWFIDEAVEDKADHNTVKRLLGAEHLWIEPKGVTKFAVENTAWAIIVGNSGMGSVRVTGTAVDRRMSIVRIDRTLASWVRERHAAEISEDSDAAAQVWIGETGLPALRDREQVGRWLHALLRRHGAVQHVEAFHGEAYREIVESQKPFHDLLFDAVLRSETFSYIRKPFLYEMYADMQKRFNNSSGVVKNRTFYRALDTWARRNGVPLVAKKVKWSFGTRDPRLSELVPESRSTADVIYRSDRMSDPTHLCPNEGTFRDGDHGDWRVSI